MSNRHRRTSRVERRGPALPPDPLDRDLEAVPSLGHFSRKGTLWWGLAVPLAAEVEGSNSVAVPGQDWHIVFHPTASLRLPLFSETVFKRTGARKYPVRKVRRATALLAVNTGTDRLNEARDYGRPAVRTLLGLARIKFPIILPHETIWEGAIQPRRRTRDGVSLRYSSVHQWIEASPVDPTKLTRDGLNLAPFSLRSLPQQVGLSLRWYGLAWTSRRRADQFIQLWLSALVLIDHGYSKSQRKKISQDCRIERYVKAMALSKSRAQDLGDTLKSAYNVRNTMIHEGDESGTTEEAVEQLQAAVTELLSFQLG